MAVPAEAVWPGRLAAPTLAATASCLIPLHPTPPHSVCAALRLPPAPPPAPLPSTSGAALPTLLRAPSRVAPAPHGAVPDDRGSRASSLGAGGVRLTPLSRELSAAHVSDASYRPSSVAERAGCIDGRQRVWTPRRARPSGRDPVAG